MGYTLIRACMLYKSNRAHVILKLFLVQHLLIQTTPNFRLQHLVDHDCSINCTHPCWNAMSPQLRFDILVPRCICPKHGTPQCLVQHLAHIAIDKPVQYNTHRKQKSLYNKHGLTCVCMDGIKLVLYCTGVLSYPALQREKSIFH